LCLQMQRREDTRGVFKNVRFAETSLALGAEQLRETKIQKARG